MLCLLAASMVIVLLGPLPQEITSLENNILEDGYFNDLIQDDVKPPTEVKRKNGINYKLKDLLPDEIKKKSKTHRKTSKSIPKNRQRQIKKKIKKSNNENFANAQKKKKKSRKSSEGDKNIKRKNKNKKNVKNPHSPKGHRNRTKTTKTKSFQDNGERTELKKQKKTNIIKSSLDKVKMHKKAKKTNANGPSIIKTKSKQDIKHKQRNGKRKLNLKESEAKKGVGKSIKDEGIKILRHDGKTRATTRQGVCGSTVSLLAEESVIIFSTKDKRKTKCKTKFQGPSNSKLSISCPLFDLYQSPRCKKESLKLRKLPGYNGKLCGSMIVSGTTTSNSLKFVYKRKNLKKKQCSAGFICIITVE
ncbi:unnamed protein product, partial [Meganyctiphanes norvegica]